MNKLFVILFLSLIFAISNCNSLSKKEREKCKVVKTNEVCSLFFIWEISCVSTWFSKEKESGTVKGIDTENGVTYEKVKWWSFLTAFTTSYINKDIVVAECGGKAPKKQSGEKALDKEREKQSDCEGKITEEEYNKKRPVCQKGDYVSNQKYIILSGNRVYKTNTRPKMLNDGSLQFDGNRVRDGLVITPCR